MIFENESGRPVIINGQHVVAISPAYDGTEPIIGLTSILFALPPPNVPQAGHTTINVKGRYQDVAAALGLHNHDDPSINR